MAYGDTIDSLTRGGGGGKVYSPITGKYYDVTQGSFDWAGLQRDKAEMGLNPYGDPYSTPPPGVIGAGPTEGVTPPGGGNTLNPPVGTNPGGTSPGGEEPWTPPGAPRPGAGGPTGPGLENPYEPWGEGNAPPTRDWGFIAPKEQDSQSMWGGYDPDYNVYERYQPGQDSPWGNPLAEGGNESFYQQQFNNMLRQDQNFRNRSRAAQLRGAEAAERGNTWADNKAHILKQVEAGEATPGQQAWYDKWVAAGKPESQVDMMWAGMDLPEVRVSTGASQPGRVEFVDDYAGMGVGDLWANTRDRSVFNTSESSKATRDVLNNIFNDERRAAGFEGMNLSDYGSAQEAYDSLDLDAIVQGMNRPNVARQGIWTLLNQAWNEVAPGPSAPAGYAAPI